MLSQADLELWGLDGRLAAAIDEDLTRGERVCVVETGGARLMASILHTPPPVGTAIAVAPGEAAVGHAAAPDDVVVFALEGGAPRVAHEQAG